MAQPVIGLTLDHEPPGGYSKFPWYAIRENYCNAVRRAGGLPILLPHDPEAKAVARVFDTLDDPVLGDRVDDQARPCLLDRLVMRAVYREVGGSGDAMQ